MTGGGSRCIAYGNAPTRSKKVAINGALAEAYRNIMAVLDGWGSKKAAGPAVQTRTPTAPSKPTIEDEKKLPFCMRSWNLFAPSCKL
jgi:hypothetical protein